MAAVSVRSGGDPQAPALLLLHGMSGNARVWNGVLDGLSGWRWVAPDLPGHGASAALPAYRYVDYARALVPVVPAGAVVLGHSLGGVVGLSLAALVPLRHVVTVGMRADWPQEFVDQMQLLSEKPAKVFPERDTAAGFLLRINGLSGPAESFIDAGLRLVDGGWTPAQDPASYRMRAPDFVDLIGRATAGGTRVTLAYGETDVMVRRGDYDSYAQRFGADVVELPRLGHNAHVEDPAAVRRLLPA